MEKADLANNFQREKSRGWGLASQAAGRDLGPRAAHPTHAPGAPALLTPRPSSLSFLLMHFYASRCAGVSGWTPPAKRQSASFEKQVRLADLPSPWGLGQEPKSRSFETTLRIPRGRASGTHGQMGTLQVPCLFVYLYESR